MEIITSLDAELKNKYPATVIALGTFDGLHLGHTDVINTARDYAERSGLKLAVFTFSNHPLALIRPDLVPVRIISAEEKIKLLESFGVDYLINIPFTEDFAALSPDEFLEKLACFNYRCLVVGENFTYGFLGSGKTETQVFGWMLPRRILFYPKIVKAERSNKGKTEFSPARSQGIGGKQRFWFNEVEHVRNKRKHMPAGCAVLH